MPDGRRPQAIHACYVSTVLKLEDDRVQFIAEWRDDVPCRQVLALTKELQEKIKEVETRAEWLKSQRLVIQQ